MKHIIPPCSGKAIDVENGRQIVITDVEGTQVVDFFAEAKGNHGEFVSPGVTIDVNESLRLKVGDKIYSNLYNPMFEIVYDDVGEHDLLHPCCRKEMYDFFYHNGDGHPSCFDNINSALGTSHPIIRPVNLFMYTKINSDGSISVEKPVSKPGDKIILRTLMDVRLGVAACSVSESMCNGGSCGPVSIEIL